MFLTSEKVAELTGLSLKQVQELVAKKEIPYNQESDGTIKHWDSDIYGAFTREPLKSMVREPEIPVEPVFEVHDGDTVALPTIVDATIPAEIDTKIVETDPENPFSDDSEPETPEVKAKRHYKRRKRAKKSE